jgi:hypothetical protein
VDGLKALDPNRPIREADIDEGDRHVGFVPKADIQMGHKYIFATMTGRILQ